MQVTKLRTSTQGLVPAGHYFAQIARELEAANAREDARRTRAEEQERKLEARYRRAKATPRMPANTHGVEAFM